MHIFGKILGAIFGWLILGPFGLLVGLFIGHQFDKARQYQNFSFSTSGNSEEQLKKQNEFFYSAFAVMGHVSKAKGQVREEDIRLAMIMMDRMQLNEHQRAAAQEAFRAGKSSDFPLEHELTKVLESSGGRYDLLQFFLELQISAAFADGDIHPNERDILHKIASVLGFSAEQLERRLKMQEAAFRFKQGDGFNGGQQGYSSGQQYSQGPTRNQLADAYKVLDISEDADSKQIKRAYRKLMNEHHPDKLMAKGLPPEMMNMAKEKSQEIQKAYDMIKKEKGFK
ncbi:co-chaperone DjlA [Vibrio salinus]|uniref:co-chaperone DjlA n=1 Tax=Vibrio salinus TaxID=2899784 RepID=UPI001E3AB1F1|nr:co-chaperone DjlA [Vibrio salinus]MCE0494119.1 co-chaperone DjlA [Vibrio salinus]